MNRFTHKISLSPASVLPDLLCEQPLLQHFAISGRVPRQKAEEHQHCSGYRRDKQ